MHFPKAMEKLSVKKFTSFFFNLLFGPHLCNLSNKPRQWIYNDSIVNLTTRPVLHLLMIMQRTSRNGNPQLQKIEEKTWTCKNLRRNIISKNKKYDFYCILQLCIIEKWKWILNEKRKKINFKFKEIFLLRSILSCQISHTDCFWWNIW